MGDWLAYGTGGLAYGNADSSIGLACTPVGAGCTNVAFAGNNSEVGRMERGCWHLEDARG